MSNNNNLKKLLTGFGEQLGAIVGKNEVYEILNGEYSKSQIDAWLRRPSSTRNPSGNSEFVGSLSRYRPMPDEAFELLCEKLPRWLTNQQKNHASENNNEFLTVTIGSKQAIDIIEYLATALRNNETEIRLPIFSNQPED